MSTYTFCDECRFLMPRDPKDPQLGGECRRHAPVVLFVPGAKSLRWSGWPETDMGGCGEFQNIDERKVTP